MGQCLVGHSVQASIFDGYGGFDETAISTTPVETYPMSSFNSPAGNTWAEGNECIALRRFGCTELPTFERGIQVSTVYSGTGTAIAFFQAPLALASDDDLQWIGGTGVLNLRNNDAASYSAAGTPGVATATFTTVDGKTVTVTQGIITSVV